jgi:sugar phosphate isomerase/epimerase
MQYNRNEFLKLMGLSAVGAAALSPASAAVLPASRPAAEGLTLGLASYTFHKFSLDEAVAMAKRLGLKNIALKSMHLPLDSSAQEIKAAIDKIKKAGLTLYGGGVIYMKTPEEVDQAFEYAKQAGMSVIIGVPAYDLLERVNKKVQEHDIKMAIHNHGPGDDVYASPTTAYEKVKNLDPRVGLCIDIGHTQRIGEDPSALAEKYQDRLFDVHLKDVTTSTGDGVALEVGRGVIDIPKFLRTLKKINYAGVVAFEYEKDSDDPLAGLAESVGYVRGILKMV